jgi:hypothetical protein
MSRWWSLAALAALTGCGGPDALDAWPAALVVRSPGAQTGLTDYPVNEPPAVRLLDANGNPIQGAAVTFTVLGGGGSVTGSVATTGSDGVATVGSWTIVAGSNSMQASIPAPFRVDPVIFAATGMAQSYQIDLLYVTPPSVGNQAVFASVVTRWQQMVYGDVPDFSFISLPAGSCLGNEPAFGGAIDDLLIFVTLDSIDGPGNILGGATPCFIRNPGFTSIVGAMVFDTADLADLNSFGLLDDVIMHEMGHVIGFGTIWDAFNLLAGPASSGGLDPHFVGQKALAAFDRAGGTAYTGGLKVPVENTGGPGTVDGHWRESAFGNELMTGFVNLGSNPLSIVSVASLGDVGYLVNYGAADLYSHAFSVAPVPGAPVGPVRRIPLGNDILRVPIYTMDRRGRVTGVYRP